ncbi:SAICAR synthase-like protein [Panus rudis PR-1116 ss-1]|nr:SAICAR synthase-like protein [Panus rudis PR-1116 ss-1]
MATSIPKSASDPIPLDSQVGGHAGVMTTEDGSLIMKPAYPTEISFYQSVGADPGLAALRPFIPKFYGTLRLEGEVDASQEGQEDGGQLKVKEVEGKHKDECSWDMVSSQSIVLENISNAFLKPNILDIKLGTVLYDDDATPEKRARMEKTARETTSLETGVRLTGFQVYDLESGVAVNTPKTYGKSITAAQLSEGIAKFFPLAPDTTTTGTGLPARILLPILENLREDIAEIKEALAELHFRMVGGSLLIVYEADWARAEEGLKLFDQSEPEEDDEEVDEDEDDDGGEGKKKVGPPYVVKLIDFAHTKITPGQGPDEGVLKGVDTVLRLLDGRIKEVKAAAKDNAS